MRSWSPGVSRCQVDRRKQQSDEYGPPGRVGLPRHGYHRFLPQQRPRLYECRRRPGQRSGRYAGHGEGGPNFVTDRTNPSSVTDMRRACKNVLYTVCRATSMARTTIASRVLAGEPTSTSSTGRPRLSSSDWRYWYCGATGSAKRVQRTEHTNSLCSHKSIWPPEKAFSGGQIFIKGDAV